MHARLRTTLHRPLDLTAPGAVDELLAFHRAQFGSALMVEDSDDTGTGDETEDDQDTSDGDGSDEKSEDADEKDWKAEADKQRRINRDLERKMKQDFSKAKAAALAEFKKQQQARPGKDAGDSAGDLEAARAEARAEVESKYQRQILDLTIRSAAMGFKDPSDAPALLLQGDGAAEFLDADGKVDAQAVEDGIADLLERKPHLAAQGGKRFKGGADGGARKEQKAKPATLQDAVAARITAGKT